MKAKILVVDDDADIVTMLKDRLEWLNFETITASDGTRGLQLLEQEMPHAMLLDMQMPLLDGLDVLKRIAQGRVARRDGFDLPVIVMTAHATIAKAVVAMKEGAYDFLTKPLDVDHLKVVLQKALERESLLRQVACLRSDVEARYASIVGQSPKTAAMIELAQRAAQSDASVLLLGESGTGKELFARSIHQWSPRRDQPFVVINCVALTETLLENELFGHEKGSYTGADRLEKGKIEMADGGTVFLDEVGDMPMALQAKLLRILQDREFTRVGGTRLVRVNIRVIAATNKDLKQGVKAGTFREDLYFRLNVINLVLPPLRERPEDIAELADFFLKRHAREAKRPSVRLTSQALAALSRYPWPGNIRELDNVLARAVVLTPQDPIGPEHLNLAPPDPADTGDVTADAGLPYHEAMEEHSRRVILNALRVCGGSQTRAAERLKLQRTYLARLIRQKNINPDQPI